MTFLKFGALIFAIFVLQAQAHPQQETAVGSLVDIVREIVSRASAAVDTGLDYVFTQVQNAYRFFDNIEKVNGMEDEIIRTLLTFIASITDSELYKLKKVVNDDAKAFLVCVDQNKNILRLAEWRLLTYTADCFTFKFIFFLSALNTTIIDIQALNVDLRATASNGINNCDGKSDAEAVRCLVNVLKEVIDKASNIPDVLSADIEELKRVYRENMDYAAECIVAQADNFVSGGIGYALNQTASCFRKS